MDGCSPQNIEGEERKSRVGSAAVTGGAVVRRKQIRVVGDAVFIIVILHGRLDRLLGEHGAVDLLGRETVERFNDRLVGQRQRLGDGFAF